MLINGKVPDSNKVLKNGERYVKDKRVAIVEDSKDSDKFVWVESKVMHTGKSHVEERRSLSLRIEEHREKYRWGRAGVKSFKYFWTENFPHRLPRSQR